MPTGPAPAAGRCLTLVLGLLLVATLPRPCAAQSNTLVADLSERLIAITTDFAGTNVVLFGATAGGRDIVVTVLGPRQNQMVQRKARVGGVWFNRDRLVFEDAPGYYAVASNRPLAEIAREDVRSRLEFGPDNLRLQPFGADWLTPDEIVAFREALIRNKQRQELYSSEPGRVDFLGEQLFRTSLAFPANVPPGIYQVQVFELDAGQVTGAQRSTLVISKVGVEAEIYDFAQHQSALYGLLAIVVAISAGWLAAMIFRRN